MKKLRKIKVRYIYMPPKTPEEKEQRQKILDNLYFPIFDELLKKK